MMIWLYGLHIYVITYDKSNNYDKIYNLKYCILYYNIFMLILIYHTVN
jgi:hypothetical protein